MEVPGKWLALDCFTQAERKRLHGMMLHHYAVFRPFSTGKEGLDAKGDLVRL